MYVLQHQSRLAIADVRSWFDFIDDRGDLAAATSESLTTDSVEQDGQMESLLSDLFFEFERRSTACSLQYPFEIDRRGAITCHSKFSSGELTYLYGLFSSECSLSRYLPSDFFSKDDRTKSPNLLQILGTVAAAGLVNGSAFSFGHPRPKFSAFAEALREVVEKRVQEGGLRNKPLPGSPVNIKDGGIDVIAWRDFPDGLPGKLLLLGQCATGKNNWYAKGVRIYRDTFFSDFFSEKFPSPIIEAIFVPFCLATNEYQVKGSTHTESLSGVFRHFTTSLGIVVDRCRLAYLVPRGLEIHFGGSRVNDTASSFSEVEDWVCECLEFLRDDSYCPKRAA